MSALDERERERTAVEKVHATCEKARRSERERERGHLATRCRIVAK